MQGERAASPPVELSQSVTQVGPLVAAPSRRLERLVRAATPLRLALVQTIAAAVLVFVTLAPPDPRPGFFGLSGDTNDWRAYLRLATWTSGMGRFGSLLARVNLPPNLYLWTMRSAFAALALTNLLALAGCLVQTSTGKQARAWRWLVGPVMTCLLLLAYPPICSDVFYYAMSGHVANGGGNPYQFPLMHFVDDPLLKYQDWGGITSPYGPLWTSISRGIVAITGPDPIAAVLGFKIFAAVCALGLAGVTYLLARRLTDDRRVRLGALVLTAWQPVLLFESATGSHNDALMMLLAMGGLFVLTTPRRGAIRTGLLLIAASTLIKYVTLPLLAYAALWRLRALGAGAPWRRIIRDWILDAAAVLILVAAAFAPYWVGVTTLESLLKQSDRLVTSTLWLVPAWEFDDVYSAMAGGQLDRVGNDITLVAPFVVLPLIALLVAATLRRLWPTMMASGAGAIEYSGQRRGLIAQVNAWAVATVVFAFAPMNTHSWYAIWTIAPVVLAWVGRSQGTLPSPDTGSGGPDLDDDQGSTVAVPRWLILFLVWLIVNTIVSHTTVVR